MKISLWGPFQSGSVEGIANLLVTDTARLGDSSQDHVYILFNNGFGYFGEPIVLLAELYIQPMSLTVGDFNNDNYIDFVVVNSNRNILVVMFQNKNGSFQKQIILSTGDFSNPSSVVTDDFNSDGQWDLAVSNSYAHNVGIFIGVRNGTFLSQITFPTNSQSIPSAITSVDLNNDGQLDLIAIGNRLNAIHILLNTCDC
ncbi:unnamed protein product [Adineta ricciae]|uniref:VCBS repeat-containing protein n=1 Tax=Adineta ricciae TaxID=249248 RepID=A0A815WQB9_ADIRI|nr:unnamed protein product [Adineta ricciae]CAF1543750.1 unnamed protein product [Adineta ricciae]